MKYTIRPYQFRRDSHSSGKMATIRHLGITLTLAAVLLSTALSLSAQTGSKQEKNWPGFRGVAASGVAEGYGTPEAWNVEEKKNVLWKTPIPGLSHSSPVIWGDRVFVTTAISGKDKAELKVGLYGDIASAQDDTSHTYKVYCLNKKTGKIEWEQVASTGVPKVKRHTKSTQANSTIATDGNNVVAFFGSEGLYCYDMKGNLRWKKDFGVLDSGYYLAPEAQWGFASSPVISGTKVIVQCDVQKRSFVAALDLKNGNILWKTPRRDVPTWSTPAVLQEGGRKQVVVNGWKQIGGYDLETGEEIWWMTGGGDIPVPTPVVGHGLIYITNAHGRMAPIYAIKTTATGDISLKDAEQSNAYIAWSLARDGAYMQTPLVYGDYLYNCRDNGVVSCYEATTGKRIYQERLGTGRTGFTASSVAAPSPWACASRG